MADEDDDEHFGVFKFVSSSNSNSNPSPNSNSSQRHHLTGDYSNDEEGDWGDFVDTFSQKRHDDLFPKTTVQSNSSNGFFFATQNPTTGTATSSTSSFVASGSFDPFGVVFSDQSKKRHESQSVDSGSATASENKRWEKPKGALPLSIFGGEEAEEEPDLANLSVDGDAGNFFSVKPSQSTKNGLNFADGVGFNDFIVNLYAQAEEGKSEDVSNSDLVDGSGGIDGDDWEFKDAFTENGTTDRELGVKKDEDIAEITKEVAAAAATTAATTSTASITGNTMDGVIKVNGDIWGDFEPSTTASGFSNTGEFGDDWFVASNSSSDNPYKVVDDFHFESGLATTSGSTTSDLFSQFDLMAMDNTSNSFSNDRIHASQEKFGTFELPHQTEEKPKVADQSAIMTKDLMFDGEYQVNGIGIENNHEELMLPISNRSLHSNDSLFGEEVFSHQPSNSVGNGIKSQSLSSNISFNDLISNLYSQAEHIPAVSATQECSDNGLAQMGSNSDAINGEADFDDWEFQASSEARAENQSSVIASGKMLPKFSIKSATINLVDFYTRLKEEVYCIALHHLDDLKRAKTTAALSGEDAKAVALQDEIQVANKKLESVNMVGMKDHPTQNICVKEILEVMKDPRYQVLDSEYHLSKRISSAEKDLTSAVGLFEHAVSMLKTLTLGSMEDQFSYTSTWSKMISACAQELKHGALIWQQSSEKNVHTEIISKPKGQQYIVALGEVYRVVEVLRVSVNLYKPWIFSSLDDPMAIFASLEECDAAWSGSALEKSLCSINKPLAIAYEGTAEALLHSIESIHNLNVIVQRNPVDAMQDPICRLSLLSQRLLPDMKMVDWNGEQYILKLANLWVNCVSCDPPQLPKIQLGS